ncbi:Krueppel-like factor 17 isoform X1 [Hyaena hyaena]|uniref:Krueppel-like factor 17 isoform X1 n=1 Tax=Hyaena hyaena TaxID=95912 RepID=UPI001921CA70|nr:Krueppel-like factor 17 isoform X1 [Hyaena hyaena]
MCSPSQEEMGQEAERLSQWQEAQHQLVQDTETSMSILDMCPSPGSGVHTSSNDDPSGMQHFPQCTQLERIPLALAEAPRQNASDLGPQFNMSLPEDGVSYSSQVIHAPSQMTYCDGMSPSQPGMMVFKGPQMMALGEPSIPGVAMTFCRTLKMPSSGPPVSAPNRISMMPHISAPTMPYSAPQAVPPDRDSLTPTMSLAPTTSEVQAMLPSLAQMLPPRDHHNFGMQPAGSPSFQALKSQDHLMSQPASQEDSLLPKQPIQAPQRVERNSKAQERAPRRSPVSRPYSCQYENCGKAYTKRSHLVSHQRKHTGERPYKCVWEGCTWSFFRSDELGRHMRIHTRYRPYRCDRCGRQFMRSDHLRQHQRTHLRMPGSPDPQANNGKMAGPPAPSLGQSLLFSLASPPRSCLPLTS